MSREQSHRGPNGPESSKPERHLRLVEEIDELVREDLEPSSLVEEARLQALNRINNAFDYLDEVSDSEQPMVSFDNLADLLASDKRPLAEAVSDYFVRSGRSNTPLTIQAIEESKTKFDREMAININNHPLVRTLALTNLVLKDSAGQIIDSNTLMCIAEKLKLKPIKTELIYTTGRISPRSFFDIDQIEKIKADLGILSPAKQTVEIPQFEPMPVEVNDAEIEVEIQPKPEKTPKMKRVTIDALFKYLKITRKRERASKLKHIHSQLDIQPVSYRDQQSGKESLTFDLNQAKAIIKDHNQENF